MTRDEYLKTRVALLDEAQDKLDSGDVEASAAKQEEVKVLDKKYQLEAKAQESLSALSEVPRVGSQFEMRNMQDAAAAPGTEIDMDEVTNSKDYRKAFMNNVLKGTPMPARFRNADANTLTTDISTAIPTVVVDRIVEKMESIGMILPLVTRTSYASGVNIPTSTVKPVATWVAEGAGSDRQKKTTGVITFTAHKLRCEISMSMESGTMAISAFETSFVNQVAESMVKAIEGKIISDDTGASSNRGILAETPATGQAIEVTALDYATLVGAEAALPQAYEGGAVWCMTKKTFMSFIGMEDTAGQPIARVNYGIAGAPERTLLGRPVVLCGDYLPSFEAATTGKVFAFLFRFSDYVLNTIYDMGIQRKQDWDTEDLLTKAVMSVDGKVVDVNSLVTLKKGTAGA